MDKLISGLMLGTLLGALWVANSNRTRTLVKKGQQEIQTKVNEYIDERLASCNRKQQSAEQE